jgi:hypothetical protein
MPLELFGLIGQCSDYHHTRAVALLLGGILIGNPRNSTGTGAFLSFVLATASFPSFGNDFQRQARALRPMMRRGWLVSSRALPTRKCYREMPASMDRNMIDGANALVSSTPIICRQVGCRAKPLESVDDRANQTRSHALTGPHILLLKLHTRAVSE